MAHDQWRPGQWIQIAHDTFVNNLGYGRCGVTDSNLAEKIAEMRSRLDGLREHSTVPATQLGEVLEEL